MDLHKKFLGRAGRVFVLSRDVEDWNAVFRVPRIAATCPWKFRAEGGEKVVDGPSDDGVIVHAHINVYQADSITHSCIKQSVHMVRLNK
jgi:hypothetical protein